MKTVLCFVGVLVGIIHPAYATPPQWNVLDGSWVGFTAMQVGAPVEGEFEIFEADIEFDPDDPVASTAKVVIDINSVNSHSTERDSAIRSAGLFDVETWPEAVFEATSFRSGNVDGQYIAIGTLTIRGVTRGVEMAFYLSVDGQVAHAQGSLDILRLDYGVGQGMWADTSVVANEVTITIDIRATR